MDPAIDIMFSEEGLVFRSFEATTKMIPTTGKGSSGAINYEWDDLLDRTQL